MSWGSDWSILWGGGSSGGGPPPSGGFFVVAAIASGSTTFQVAFSEDPLFTSPLRPGDASNLERWTLTREDTGATVPLLYVRGVVGATDVLEFGIFGRFDSALVKYRITGALTLQSATGDHIIEPRAALFAGSPASMKAAAAQGLMDIRNPQTQAAQLNGGLVVRASGDYDLEGGLPLLKKLILRRLTTLPGEFFHLPDYGAGISQKGFYTTSDLVTLQASVERQVLQEPDVAAVSASVTLTSDGRITISVQARTKKTGAALAITTTLPT